MTGVSVLLPTFNRARLIGETIDSLLAQTRVPDEIIVINDGSTDDTVGVLEQYQGQVRVITKPNGGKSSALNLGLAEAQYGCIWVVDDDDIILPDTCHLLMAELDADRALGFCAGMHTDFTVDPQSNQRVLQSPGYSRASQPDEIFPDLLDGCHIFQPGLIVRRRVYEAVGPFRTDLTRSQDYEMILRIARKHRGKLLPEVVFLHREHLGDRGSAKDRFSADQNAARWKIFNQRIFSELLNDLDDKELLPNRVWRSTSQHRHRRLAQLKRACVMARQRMWAEAVAVWDGMVMEDSSKLTAAECALFDRSMSSSLGSPELFDDPLIQHSLRRLARRNDLGRFMVRRLARKVRWNLRKALADRDRRLAWRVSRFLILVFGWTLGPPVPGQKA